jgi:chemotaxis protein MotB
MAKKCPKCECPAGEKWAVPFADFLSLLLALFIALYALASVNIEKQKALKEEFVKIYGFNASADTIKEQEDTEKSMTDKPVDNVEEGKSAALDGANAQLNELEKQQEQGGNLQETINGTFMSLPAQLLFESGKAEITNKIAAPFLSRIANLISAMPDDTEINVKGYAEDSEVKNSKYQDALELSTARANNVIRELQKYKVSPDKLYSSGFGSSKSYQMSEPRVVEFELKTMKSIKKDDLDIETILHKVD